ncbi:MAG TPA: NUDIX hydrolase, partial [Ktedonobacterales bacterium]|nr:NUDIX hydrolase [Ktedonobacterales bacterium]
MSGSAGTGPADGIVFDGRRFKVRLETLVRSVGGVSQFEIVETRAAAAIIPVISRGTDAEPHVMLVRQERPAVGERTLEIPAGIIEVSVPGTGELESPEETAVRELREETGFEASGNTVRHLASIYTTPGICDEVIHIYLVDGRATPAQSLRPLDTTEIEGVVTLPLHEAVALIGRGEIRDAKSIIGLLLTRDALTASAPQPNTAGRSGGDMPAPTDATAFPFSSPTGTVEPATPKVVGTDAAGALSLENILTQEFGYANVTAYQAMEDRARVFGLYLTLVGVLAAALGAVSQLGGSFEKQYLLPLGACLLLLAGVLGTVFFRQLVKVRQAWRSSALAMARIKEYYIERLKQQVPDIEKAFLWRLETLPKGEKRGTITHLICFTTAVIGSLCTATAVLILGVYLTTQGWISDVLGRLGASPDRHTLDVLSYGAALLLGLLVFLVSLNRHTAYYDKLLSPPE